MVAPQKYPNAKRTAYLHGIADAALTEQKESADVLAAHEAAEAEAARERIRLGNVAIKARTARLKAVGKSEAAAKAFIDAVRECVDLAGEERAALAKMGEPAEMLTPASVTSRIARYWSHEIRQLVGPTAMKWGGVTLANYFRATVSWIAAEKRAVPPRLKGETS